MYVAGGEASLFDATFYRNAYRGKIEDDTVNDGPRRKTDLAKTDQLGPSMTDDDFGHADRAAADLDTYASRRHQHAPDTESDPTVLRTSQFMRMLGLPNSRLLKVLVGS